MNCGRYGEKYLSFRVPLIHGVRFLLVFWRFPCVVEPSEDFGRMLGSYNLTMA